GEERDDRGEDRREARLDAPLRPGDEEERRGDVHDRHDNEVPVHMRAPREGLPGYPEHGPEERGADRETKGDQRERAEVVNRDLDEEIARPPHEAERSEDEPVAARRPAHLAAL